jgi:hypothetical protein
MEIMRLTLVAPLFYQKDEAGPFEMRGDRGDRCFCFEIGAEEALNFEPDESRLLGKLIFGGKRDEASGETPGKEKLPAGSYLFAQEKEALDREAIIRMAVEIQQEGLWQRLKPDPRLYVRRLFEDGREVTQVFRPYTEKPEN